VEINSFALRDRITNETKDFSLLAGEEKSLEFSLPFPDLKLGDYKIIYWLEADGATCSFKKIPVPSSLTLKPLLDKTSYRVRDTVNLNVEVRNDGKFVLPNASYTLEIPGIGIADARTLSLNPSEEKKINYTFPLTENITPGILA